MNFTFGSTCCERDDSVSIGPEFRAKARDRKNVDPNTPKVSAALQAPNETTIKSKTLRVKMPPVRLPTLQVKLSWTD